MRDPDWRRLFPESDFRWSMSLRPGDAADFFAASAGGPEILALRRHLLATAPEHYVLLPDEAADSVAETLGLFSAWTGRDFRDAREAGCGLEPDWLVLRTGADGRLRVAAGVVCFPSHWSLPGKAGLPIEAVHAPVPALQESMGRQIDRFLEGLEAGTVRERENWGLSADRELDDHPRRFRPRLSGEETLDRVWLRLERQLFARLPGGGLLFGIRVSNHPLETLLASDPGLAAGIARTLRSMPEAAADYKGIGAARSAIAERVEAAAGLTSPARPESPAPPDPPR